MSSERIGGRNQRRVPRLPARRLDIALTLGLLAATLSMPPGRALAQEEQQAEEQHEQEPPALDEPMSEELAEFSLEELLAVPVEVSSYRPAQIRDTPGVVTVVTQQEIQDAGARDLIDVLNMVPGFFTGTDVWGTVGIGFRGIWAHEGKVLLLVDGHTLNEMGFQTAVIGNHIPVSLIERVEIMRGPGSVRYGGYAEVAVINIITRRPPEFGGEVFASANYGQLEGGYARRGVALSLAHSPYQVDDLSYSVSGNIGQGRIGAGPYTDLYGNSYDLEDHNEWNPRMLNASLNYRGLSVRYLYDGYVASHRDAFDEIADRTVRQDFITHSVMVSYAIDVAEGVTITPALSYRFQLPWHEPLPLREPLSSFTPEEQDAIIAERQLLHYDRSIQRLLAGVRVHWDIIEEAELDVGVQVNGDRAEWRDYDPALDGDLSGDSIYSPDDLVTWFHNTAVFAELRSMNPYLDVTAGARFEHHSVYGSSFVPRLAIGHVFGDFHFKALYAHAFKAPGIENFNLNPDVQPERTRTLELELAYAIGKHVYVSGNVFHLELRRPIIYVYDPVTDEDSYENSPRTGSMGAEMELRTRFDHGYVNASYGYYTARYLNRVPDYAVTGSRASLLAAPRHKLSVQGNVRIYEGLSLNGTAVLFGERFEQRGVDASDELVIGKRSPTLLLTLRLEYRDLFVDGLSVGFGVHNILGSNYPYAQPYRGYHASIPGQQREYRGTLSYQAGF